MRFQDFVHRPVKAATACVAALVLLAGCTGGKDAVGGPEFSLVIGHEDQTVHFNQETYLRFKEQVEQESDGRIGVKVVPNELFGDMTSLVTAVQLDSIQMTSPTAGVLGQFAKEQNVWDMPYLFDDVAHAHRVLDGKFGQDLLTGLERFDLVGLGYWENGVRHLTTDGKKVDGPDDLKRVKIRVQPNQLELIAWKATSANPTPMAYGEVYTGLQQGTIDAQENPLSVIVDARFYEVQKRVVLTGHVYSTIPLVMSKKFYDSLPVDFQEVVTTAARDTVDLNRELADQAEKDSEQVITEAGVAIDPISEKGREDFKKTMQDAAFPYLRELVGEDTVAELQQAIEEERR